MKISKKTAYAKINLGLQVLQKRLDGYHDINTVFAKINLSDFLEFEQSNSTIIKISPYFPIKNEENLIYKAISLFNTHFKTDFQFNIKLQKNIPTGAGLGGGSSDAATTLLYLNEISNYLATYEEINQIALQLGSDIPFFLNDGVATAKGRGEILEYYQIKLPFKVLVVYPNIHISTPLAYQALNRNSDIRNSIDLIDILNRSLADTSELKLLINDFEDYAFTEYPDIKEIKLNLYKSGAILALMSGSGSSVFGLFSDEESALIAKSKFDNYSSFVADFVF